jgi:ABC-type transport system involved in cytochrome c biogenesis permease subunit
MTIADPKIMMAVLTWLIYGLLLASRRWAGLSPRRTAWLSAVGFAIVLLNFLPVAYFFARSHNFA